MQFLLLHHLLLRTLHSLTLHRLPLHLRIPLIPLPLLLFPLLAQLARPPSSIPAVWGSSPQHTTRLRPLHSPLLHQRPRILQREAMEPFLRLQATTQCHPQRHSLVPLHPHQFRLRIALRPHMPVQRL